jgi:type II secretory pathway component PulK
MKAHLKILEHRSPSTAQVPLAQRNGIALMAAVVVLVILSLILSAIAWQIVASGRMLQHRAYQLQARWLARAGIEMAASELLIQQPQALESPYAYEQTDELIESSHLEIEISSVPDRINVFRVTCLARYPTDTVASVTRKQTRVFQRVVDNGKVRLNCLESGDDFD